MNSKTRSRFLTPVLALTGLAAVPAGALAQEGPSAARACATISSDLERLDCYDRALRAGRAEAKQAGRSESPAQTRGEPAQPAAAATAAQAAAAPAPPASAAPAPAAPAQRQAAAAREAPAQRAAPQASTGDTGKFEVTVVEVRRIRRIADVTFVTKDGRVWRQTDEKRVRFPDTPFRAVISSGFLGSHFLTPAGSRFSVHVSERRP